ncbi:hypothetical protein DsansV1_C10g0097681 [Dioscorea sansibarensis]
MLLFLSHLGGSPATQAAPSLLSSTPILRELLGSLWISALPGAWLRTSALSTKLPAAVPATCVP